MNFTDYIVPVMIVTVLFVGLLKKVDVFDAFIEGAKEGLETSVGILPSLIALMTCVGMFKASGGMEVLISLIKPVTDSVGFPEECTPLVLLRPISGSGSISIFENILSTYGADSFAGRVASVMLGSTETTFYTIAVYYGATKIKKTRHTLIGALSGDLVGWVASGIIVRLFFY